METLLAALITGLIVGAGMLWIAREAAKRHKK